MRRAAHSITRPRQILSALLRRIRHVITYKIAYIKAEKRGKVYFFPERPHPYTAVYRAFHLLGIKVLSGLPDRSQKSPTVFVWEDSTLSQHEVPALPQDCFTINKRCTDISKSLVGRIHLEVFGYQAEVNPLIHCGAMVAKSDENGAHSGKVIHGPIKERQAGWVYQEVIQNTSEGLNLCAGGPGKAIDFRVPVFGTVQHQAYIKYRSLESRFGNVNDLVELVSVERLFNSEEIGKLNKFCEGIGLDYGEIDVIRDAVSNRIFVLDINKTPLGPPNGLSKKHFMEALRFYQQTFGTFLSLRQGGETSELWPEKF